MGKINDGGSAFPVADPFGAHSPANIDEAKRLANGMTLRDYFAIRATDKDILPYMSKGVPMTKAVPDSSFGLGGKRLENVTVYPTREQARYAFADAMLRAREAT